MTAPVRKICLLGPFGVGKTSTAARFVHQTFSETYLTTVGVKIDTKIVTRRDHSQLKFVIWDVAGTDIATANYRAYLRGAAAYLLVADGTRPETLDDAMHLRAQLADDIGSKPWIGLLNKADLTNDWKIEPTQLAALSGERRQWREASAKTGNAIDQAFADLAEQL